MKFCNSIKIISHVFIILHLYLFQTDQWGNVEWAHDLELHDTSARVAAAAMFVQCHSSEHLTKTKI